MIAPAATEIEVTPISLDEINGGEPQTPPAQAGPQPTELPKPKEQEQETVDFAKLFTKEEPNPAGSQPPAEVQEKDQDESLPSKLRAEISRKNQEIRKVEADLKAEIAEKDRQLAEINDQFDLFRREVSVTDPQLAPEVVNASSSLNKSIDRVSKTLPPAAAREFLKNAKALVDEWSGLGDINDAGYDDRYEALRAKLVKGYGSHADEVLKQLPGLEEKVSAIKDAVRSAASNSTDVLSERALKSHKESRDLFQKSLEATLTPSAELSKADPYAARNIIAGLIQGSPEFKEVSERLVGFLEQGMVPPAPLSKEAEAGLTPDQRKHAVVLQGQTYQNASGEIYRNAPIAYHALAALPIVAKALHDLKREYDALVGTSPTETRKSGEDQSVTKPKEAPSNPNGIRPITMEEIMATE